MPKWIARFLIWTKLDQLIKEMPEKIRTIPEQIVKETAREIAIATGISKGSAKIHSRVIS